MPELAEAPPQVRALYHKSIMEALQTEDGRDAVAMALGAPSPGLVEAPGYFEGETQPGTQTLLTAPQRYRSEGEIEPGAKDLIDAYAAAVGTLLHQKAVAWHRAFPAKSLKEANGAEYRLGRPLTEEETVRMAEALEETMGTSEVTPIGSEGGFRLLNLDYLDIENKKFHKQAKAALDRVFPDAEVERVPFRWQGNYLENDWSTQPNGEGYRQLLSERPDLQEAVQDIVRRLRPEVQAVNEGFAREYGFTIPEWSRDTGGVGLPQRGTEGPALSRGFDQEAQEVVEGRNGIIRVIEGPLGRVTAEQRAKNFAAGTRNAVAEQLPDGRWIVREKPPAPTGPAYGAILDEQSKALDTPPQRSVDPEGREVVSQAIAGLRDGKDVGLSSPEIMRVAKAISRFVLSTTGNLAPYRGQYDYDRGVLSIAQDLEPSVFDRVIAHETGHAIEHKARSGSRTSPVEDLPDAALDEMREQSAKARPDIWNDQDIIAKEGTTMQKAYESYRNRMDELLADNLERYMRFPKEYKREAPNAAKWLRSLVNPSDVAKYIGLASVTPLMMTDMIAQFLPLPEPDNDDREGILSSYGVLNG